MKRKPSPSYKSASYDPDEFYIRSKDWQGHSTTMRVPDDIAPIARQIVEAGLFPYDSTQDVLRDALVHRLHYLANNQDSPGLAMIIDRQHHLAEAQKLVAELDAMEELLSTISSVTERVMRLGDPESGATMLDAYEHAAASFPTRHQARLNEALNKERAKLAALTN